MAGSRNAGPAAWRFGSAVMPGKIAREPCDVKVLATRMFFGKVSFQIMLIPGDDAIEPIEHMFLLAEAVILARVFDQLSIVSVEF
jgi:hypothetical protein